MRRRAVTAAEVIIATLVLGAALVPVYHAFVRSQITIGKSRLAYMAIHVAREELEDLRQTPFDQIRGHDWERVIGPLFARTVRFRSPNPMANPLVAPPLGTSLTYPPEYARIFTRLIITDAPGDRRLKRAVLDVRWEETGAGSQKDKPAIQRFETVISSLNLER